MNELTKIDNRLEVIVKDSGLETTKAQYILDKFTGYFSIASEWEKRAKDIVVTSADNKVEMQLARAGRLFLREKRIGIEKARVELKEQALREGKAIDGIANILKALIVPIEEYLDKQERFVEIKAQEEVEAKRIADEKKAEEERLALEEAQRVEQEQVRLENIKLKAEAEAREKKMAEERAKAEVEKARLEEVAKKEREEAEKLAKAEKDKADKILADEKAKALAEKIKIEESARKAQEESARLAKVVKESADKIAEAQRVKLEKERLEKERIQKLLDEQVECPFCHQKFNIERKN